MECALLIRRLSDGRTIGPLLKRKNKLLTKESQATRQGTIGHVGPNGQSLLSLSLLDPTSYKTGPHAQSPRCFLWLWTP